MPCLPSIPTRSLLGLACALIGCFQAGQASAQIPCQYAVAATIQAPPGPFGLPSPTIGTTISPNGRYVVGYFNPGAIGYDRAFAYDVQTQVFHVIPLPPGGLSSYANDVNDAGLAVGTNGLVTGFIYSIPQQQYLHTLTSDVPNGNCVITGINSSNVVCGWRSITNSGQAPGAAQSAFRWSVQEGFDDLGIVNGYYTSAHDISDNGHVAVADSIINGTVALLWNGRRQTPITLPVGWKPYVRRINGFGTAAGTAAFGLSSQPFLWKDGVATMIGTMPGFDAGGVGGINRHSVVTGVNTVSQTNVQRAYVWHGGWLRNLTSLLTSGNLVVTRSWGVSDGGRILGESGYASLLLDPVWGRPGDTNCDSVINVTDLLRIISQWGSCAGCQGDLNGDDTVGAPDLFEVILNWGTTGGGP